MRTQKKKKKKKIFFQIGNFLSRIGEKTYFLALGMGPEKRGSSVVSALASDVRGPRFDPRSW